MALAHQANVDGNRASVSMNVDDGCDLWFFGCSSISHQHINLLILMIKKVRQSVGTELEHVTTRTILPSRIWSRSITMVALIARWMVSLYPSLAFYHYDHHDFVIYIGYLNEE